MSNQVKLAIAKQAGKEAGIRVTAGAGQLGAFLKENHWSIRGLSFIGSLGMLVFSILTLVSVFGALTDMFGYIANAYSFLFAFVMFAVEAKDSWPLVEVCTNLSPISFLFRGQENGFLEVSAFYSTIWAGVSSSCSLERSGSLPVHCG